MTAFRFEFQGVLDADPTVDEIFSGVLAYSGVVIYETTEAPKSVVTSPGSFGQEGQLTTTSTYDVVFLSLQIGDTVVLIDTAAAQNGIEIADSTSMTSDAVAFLGSATTAIINGNAIADIEVNLSSAGTGMAFSEFGPADIADNFDSQILFNQKFVFQFSYDGTFLSAIDEDNSGVNGTSFSFAETTVVLGTADDDIIDGSGPGGGQYLGGDGDDVFVVDDADDLPIELAGEGLDTVQASLSWVLGDNLENLTLLGQDPIDATGNDLSNVLQGNAGANVLDGKSGADTMEGGLGSDTYYVDNDNDQVLETGNTIVLSHFAGGVPRRRGGEPFPQFSDRGIADDIDQVIATVSYALTDFVENLSLDGAADIDGLGNALDNEVVGNAGDNVLNSGIGGNDTLIGNEGNDTFVVANKTGATLIDDLPGEDDVLDVSTFLLGGNVSELAFSRTAGDTLLISNSGTGTVEVAAFFDVDTNPIRFIDIGRGPVDISGISDPETLSDVLTTIDPLSLLIDGEQLYQSRVTLADGDIIEAEMAQIFRQYLGGLGREPAAQGYQFWWDRIEDGRLTFVKAAQLFIDSPEFIAKADTDHDTMISNDEFVDHMYFNVFGRTPAESGRNFWLESIDRSSQAVAFTNMLQSPEFVLKTVTTVSDWQFWGDIV